VPQPVPCSAGQDGGVGERRLIFGEAPEQYHRHRPRYPREVVDLIATLAGAQGRILEVGAGTGKLTADLLARGLAVEALEPSGAMAAVLRTTIGGSEGATVLEVGFEDLPPGAGPYDVVAAAQSWHWLREGERLDVAASALRSGGHLVLAWNREEHPGPVGAAIVAAYERFGPELAGIDDRAWMQAIVEEVGADARFTDVERREVAWPLSRSCDDYLAVLGTYSGHRLLESASRDALYRAIGDAIEANGGSIDLDGRTVVVTARRS